MMVEWHKLEVSSNKFSGACSLRYTCLVPDGRMTSSRGHVSRSRSHFVQQSSQQSGLQMRILYCTLVFSFQRWGYFTVLQFLVSRGGDTLLYFSFQFLGVGILYCNLVQTFHVAYRCGHHTAINTLQGCPRGVNTFLI